MISVTYLTNQETNTFDLSASHTKPLLFNQRQQGRSMVRFCGGLGGAFLATLIYHWLFQWFFLP